MVLLRWLRESAGMLLPGGGLLGQVGAARMLVQRGVAGDIAGATATVDVTIEAVAQLFVTAIGLLLLLERGVAGHVVHAAAIGLILAALAVVALIGIQRLPPHSPPAEALRALGHRLPVRWRQAVRDTQAAILCLHADRGRLAGAFACHSAAWVLGSVEILALLALAGRPIAFTDALIIEAIAQALRSVGFMLPGAVGIQEGAIVGAAALVGVPPGPALTVALVRRGREVLTSLPGLLVWQQMQGRVAVPPPQQTG
jgi:putative membrane protein